MALQLQTNTISSNLTALVYTGIEFVSSLRCVSNHVEKDVPCSKMTHEVPIDSAEMTDLAGPSNYQSIIDSALAAPPTASDFSTSLSTWREVNLPAIQSSLETLCPSLISAQKDALLSRKRLAEQTREFRKLGIESQGEAIKPLLKSYQTEIDSLTKRAKSAENAVLGVRDKLQNAGDPYPILEAILVSAWRKKMLY